MSFFSRTNWQLRAVQRVLRVAAAAGKRRRWRRLRRSLGAAALLAFFVALSSAARADLTVVTEDSDDGLLEIYRLTVTPAAEPNPALKHRLVLREAEYKPGNAAIHYLRSFAESGLSGTWKGVEEEYGFDEVHSWYGTDVPLSQLPPDARKAAEKFDSLVEGFLETASNRAECDWGHNLAELQGTEIYSYLLPEVQETRSLSRMLALRTRVAIADGDYEKAIDQLRMNYRLSVNTGQGPFLVSALVGIAEAGVSNSGLIELIAAPDSPNMYWAVAELPRPLVSLRDSVRLEMSMLPRIFPTLDEAAHSQHSPEEWARLLAKEWQSAENVMPSSIKASPEVRQMGVAAVSLVVYPAAKRRLIDGGMDADRVEQMPVGQVVALDAYQESRRIADEMEKWFYVPYHETRDRDLGDPLEQHGVAAITRGFGYVLCQLLLPAVNAARSAEIRLDRHINAIQTVEAIRMHAAEVGSLPASLDEITCVPVPENPCTDAPFLYRLDDDTAVLDLPQSDGVRGVAWRFEIKLQE